MEVIETIEQIGQAGNRSAVMWARVKRLSVGRQPPGASAVSSVPKCSVWRQDMVGSLLAGALGAILIATVGAKAAAEAAKARAGAKRR